MTKVLICGPVESGTARIHQLVINMVESNNLTINVMTDWTNTATTISSSSTSLVPFDEDNYDYHIYESTNFWKMYNYIQLFDIVILCVKDSRDMCETYMHTYIQNFQCWSIFSDMTLKYELYGPKQIFEISNLLQLPIEGL